MKTRYRLMRRGSRGNMFYCVDSRSGERASLHTADEDAARQIVAAKNQAERQPVLNLQIAKAYLAGTDNGLTGRTWQDAMEALTKMKHGANQERWRRVASDKALAPLFPRVVIETRAEALLKAMQHGKVSTNIYLRRLHNFCVDMAQLPLRVDGTGEDRRLSGALCLARPSAQQQGRAPRLFQKGSGHAAAVGRIQEGRCGGDDYTSARDRGRLRAFSAPAPRSQLASVALHPRHALLRCSFDLSNEDVGAHSESFG